MAQPQLAASAPLSSSLIWQVFWIALLTDLATGLGALPFAFKRELSKRWEGISCAVAGGMMVSASVFSLAGQGLHRGSVWSIAHRRSADAARADQRRLPRNCLRTHLDTTTNERWLL